MDSYYNINAQLQETKQTTHTKKHFIIGHSDQNTECRKINKDVNVS